MVFITHSGFKTEKYICVLMSVEKNSVLFAMWKKIIIYIY